MLNQKYMRGVLSGGGPKGGSVTVAIAVVVVLSSGVPVVLFSTFSYAGLTSISSP